MKATMTNCATGVWALIVIAGALALVASMGLPAIVGNKAYAAQPKSHIALSLPANVSVSQGDECRIMAKASKGAKLRYKSLKKSVATVSSEGVVKAKRPGKATITVTAKKGKKVVRKKVKMRVVSPDVAYEASASQIAVIPASKQAVSVMGTGVSDDAPSNTGKLASEARQADDSNLKDDSNAGNDSDPKELADQVDPANPVTDANQADDSKRLEDSARQEEANMERVPILVKDPVIRLFLQSEETPYSEDCAE